MLEHPKSRTGRKVFYSHDIHKYAYIDINDLQINVSYVSKTKKINDMIPKEVK